MVYVGNDGNVADRGQRVSLAGGYAAAGVDSRAWPAELSRGDFKVFRIRDLGGCAAVHCSLLTVGSWAAGPPGAARGELSGGDFKVLGISGVRKVGGFAAVLGGIAAVDRSSLRGSDAGAIGQGPVSGGIVPWRL